MWDALSQYPTIPFAVTAVVLILWPPPKRPLVEEQRQARLAELESGTAERFFEERRELETYGPKSSGLYRFWGFLLLALSIAPLLLTR